MAHELPPLPYDYAALEPAIDAQTMKLHHDMHHARVREKSQCRARKASQPAIKSAEDLIRDLNAVPEDIRGAVRNNGGGHVNHTMFWKIMKPKGGGDPTGAIADAIKKSFGNFNDFKTKFNDAGDEAIRQRLGLAGWQARRRTCKSSARRTRTTPSRKDCSQFSATTFGSTPTI